MKIFLRSWGPAYVNPNASDETISAVQANLGFGTAGAIIRVDNYSVSSDTVVRSGNLVTLRGPSDTYLSVEDPLSVDAGSPSFQGYRMMNDGSVGTPRPGREVFKVTKLRGSGGSEIRHGDTIALGVTLLPPAPGEYWLAAHPTPGSTAVVWSRFGNPTVRGFDFLEPTDLGDFAAPESVDLPYELRGTTASFIARLSVAGGPGIGLPGGSGFRVSVLNERFVQPVGLIQLVPEGATSVDLEIGLKEHRGSLSPCAPAFVDVLVESLTSPRRITRRVTLRPAPPPFMRMEIQEVRGGGCRNIFDWNDYRHVTATLRLEHDERIGESDALDVALSKEGSAIYDLVQESHRLSYREQIRFTFGTRRFRGSKGICAALRASFDLEGKPERPWFAVLIDARGVVLDPR